MPKIVFRDGEAREQLLRKTQDSHLMAVHDLAEVAVEPVYRLNADGTWSKTPAGYQEKPADAP